MRRAQNLAGCVDHGHTWKHIGFAAAHAGGLVSAIDIESGLVCAHQVYASNYEWLRYQFHLQERLAPVDPETFRALLRFVLSNSYICYENRRYYRQKLGAPMGARIFKFVSNSYMYLLTKDVIQYPPAWLITFQRHQKNLILIACFHPSHGTNLITNLLQSISREPNFRWEWSECGGNFVPGAGYGNLANQSVGGIAHTLNCMDVVMSYEPNTATFKSEPDMKKFPATQLIHQYGELTLRVASKHPASVLKCISLSHFSRLKRLCSSSNVFNEASRVVAHEMRLRGYLEEECDFSKNAIDHSQSLSPLSDSSLL